MKSHKYNDLINKVFKDRTRTNLLKTHEQRLICWLVQRIPGWVTSDFLTGIGLAGNIIVSGSFILAALLNRNWLMLGLAGFIINWFGDSLDGRLAYYRNKPRKNYGFSLDVTIDWISIIIVGFGYIVYAQDAWELLGYGFVVMYGWEMILALIRYKLTGQYIIDSGKAGPTEVRIIISLMMIMEVLFPGSLNYLAGMAVLVLFVVNIVDTNILLKVADGIDKNNK
ncbi:MAG: CDP-alcohol phosphatidyltransferase [Bacteroidales bacterium]|nr:CDP-alcohol phosphatidyltransferase [Bacteroidales bacterium]